MALLPTRLNPVCPVHFAGFVADTYSLGRQGWNIAIEEDPQTLCMYMTLFHKSSGLRGIAELTDFDFYRWRAKDAGSYGSQPSPTFVVRQMGSKLVLRYETGFQPFALQNWVDTVPSTVMTEECEIMQLPLFRKLDTPVAEQLIVEPDDVSAMLEQIRKMQSPEQAAIRARNRSRERGEEVDVPRIHATILTFPKAA